MADGSVVHQKEISVPIVEDGELCTGLVDGDVRHVILAAD